MSKNKTELSTIFDFNAEHNGVSCIASLKQDDIGTENQFWFTTKMLCEIFDESDKTIRNNIENLTKDGELSIEKNYNTQRMPASDGKMYNTTIYNLEVLNKLGMCCFRGNKHAKEIRNAFNDVLVKHETNQTQSINDIAKLTPQLLRLLADRTEELEAEKEKNHQLEIMNKSLQAQNGVLSQDYKSNKDLCDEIFTERLTKYAISTLKSKVSKVLQKLSHDNDYSISEQIIVVDGVERRTPYYHVDVCNMIKDMLRDDPNALRYIK